MASVLCNIKYKAVYLRVLDQANAVDAAVLLVFLRTKV